MFYIDRYFRFLAILKYTILYVCFLQIDSLRHIYHVSNMKSLGYTIL